jgi:hypothetical protein
MLKMDNIQNTLMKPEVKILKLISTLFLWGLILIGVDGCNVDCEYGIELRDDHFTFALVDKSTSEYLFQESNLTYHIDTFKIFDQNQVQLGEHDYSYFRDGSYGVTATGSASLIFMIVRLTLTRKSKNYASRITST